MSTDTEEKIMSTKNNKKVQMSIVIYLHDEK